MCLETKFQPFRMRNDKDIRCPTWRYMFHLTFFRLYCSPAFLLCLTGMVSGVMTNGSDSWFWLNLSELPPRGTWQAHRRNKASSGKFFILAHNNLFLLIHICCGEQKWHSLFDVDGLKFFVWLRCNDIGVIHQVLYCYSCVSSWLYYAGNIFVWSI